MQRRQLITAIPGLFGAALSLSFPLAARAAETEGTSFAVTDLLGREVRFEKAPERIVVANYILNFLMTGGAASLSKVVALPQDGWEATRTDSEPSRTQRQATAPPIPSTAISVSPSPSVGRDDSSTSTSALRPWGCSTAIPRAPSTGPGTPGTSVFRRASITVRNSDRFLRSAVSAIPPRAANGAACGARARAFAARIPPPRSARSSKYR